MIISDPIERNGKVNGTRDESAAPHRRTKGYGGDISPKRASRILRQRSDAVMLDIRDLKQVAGSEGARGVPDLRPAAHNTTPLQTAPSNPSIPHRTTTLPLP